MSELNRYALAEIDGRAVLLRVLSSEFIEAEDWQAAWQAATERAVHRDSAAEGRP
ncbi:hypothetical protein [Verticiella sediminum]|uniref:hypothetical protein n=1 Tax=Verticiella sediminum TaxID=1247510 RepID=UPI001478BB77|nr:hypothetical protein [Verticiella sediminum]